MNPVLLQMDKTKTIQIFSSFYSSSLEDKAVQKLEQKLATVSKYCMSFKGLSHIVKE